MASKVRNLLNRNGRFIARLSVPSAVRPFIGKGELLEPLGADRKEALRKLPGAIGRMHDRLNAARDESRPARPSVRVQDGRAMSDRQMATSHYERELALDIAERGFKLPDRLPPPIVDRDVIVDCENIGPRSFTVPDDPQFDAMHHAYSLPKYDPALFRPGYQVVLRKVASGRFSDEEAGATVGWILDSFRIQGVPVPQVGTAEWRERMRVLAGAHLEVLKRSAERDEGDFAGTPTHPALVARPVPQGDPLLARCISLDSDKPLKEILPQFIAERKAKPHTNYESLVTVRMLDEFLGEQKPLYRITRADVRAFKNALAETPSNYVKRFPGKVIPQAIKANKERAKPFPTLNARTINDKYLGRLHSIFNWCVKNDLIPDNPAANQKIDTVKDGAPTRLNFSPDDLSRIFGKHFAKRPLDEDQWAMLISLFTGMRASELGQIKLDSIRHERGVLVFAVEEMTKTSGSQRLIPVHSKLMELGLEKRVEALRSAQKTHLFPKWHRDCEETRQKTEGNGKLPMINHFYPRFIPRRFNTTYLPKVGIRDSRKVWHSFRHTFKTGLARAGVSRSVQDELCEHDDNSAGAAYVHDTSVEAMKEAIEKLKFDGFELAKS